MLFLNSLIHRLTYLCLLCIHSMIFSIWNYAWLCFDCLFIANKSANCSHRIFNNNNKFFFYWLNSGVVFKYNKHSLDKTIRSSWISAKTRLCGICRTSKSTILPFVQAILIEFLSWFQLQMNSVLWCQTECNFLELNWYFGFVISFKREIQQQII